MTRYEQLKADIKNGVKPIKYFDNQTTYCACCNKLRYGGYTSLPDSKLCCCSNQDDIPTFEKANSFPKTENPPPCPPLGLMPHKIWVEHRKVEIEAAILRYIVVNKEVPQKWVEELQWINTLLNFNQWP